MARHLSLRSLCFLTLLAGLSRTQCPISGCDGLRSFSSAAAKSDERSLQQRQRNLLATPPRLLWSYETYVPSGAGCVTDGVGGDAVVICPTALGQNVSAVSFAAENGSVLWTLSLTSQAVLPLVSYNGESVVCDGETLDWLDRDGRSLAPPVTLYPTQGALFDLTITRSTSIVTMLYRCGFISTYTVDGVPISGLWLNETVDGVEGTFIPLANPVMNDTHLYILSAFRPHEQEEKENFKKISTLHLRLYAINVAAALEKKFTILWTFNKTISGSIAYINTPVTFCNSVPPDSRRGDNYQGLPHSRGGGGGLRSPRVLGTPPGVLTMLGGRLLGSVTIQTESGEMLSFNMSIRDLGKNFSIVSSGFSDRQISSLSWSNPKRGLRDIQRTAPNSTTGERFWVSLVCPKENQSILEELIEVDRPALTSLVLNTLLTTPVTILDLPPSLTTDDDDDELLVFATADQVSGEGEVVGESLPQLVGVTRDDGGRRGGGGGIGGGKRSVPTVTWSVPLPHSKPAQGQISSFSLNSGTLLFITTPLGVYAYKLTS